jgi:general secretion pathway protein A
MYREYYCFSEDPFDLRPDPKFLYMARSHWEVFSAMMSGVKEKKGIIVITGQVGIGKTILIYALLKDLSEGIKTAFIFNPNLDFKSMLETILHELGVPLKEREKDIRFLLSRFRTYLNQRSTQGESVTVIIDEAQSLDAEVLESLCRLSDPETAAAKSLQILLVGHPELGRMVNSKKLEATNRKIGVSAQIKPLTHEEGRGYIHHRLKIAGRDIYEVFTPGAVKKICKYAKGIPRVINLICDHSLSIGYEQSRPIIDSKIVRQAFAGLDRREYENAEARSLPILPKTTHYMAIRVIIFLLSLGMFILAIKKILPLVTG